MEFTFSYDKILGPLIIQTEVLRVIFTKRAGHALPHP